MSARSEEKIDKNLPVEEVPKALALHKAKEVFEKTDKIIIGPYSDRMIKHERNAPAGGFTGKINLYKIKEIEVDEEVVA